jgi:hypothetical protein
MRIADAFDIKTRFMRSVNLERDFRDASALEGYVLTPHIRASLERLAGGLAPRSGQRAWRITGDYGTGKSSFALALSHLFWGKPDRLPDGLAGAIDFSSIGLDEPPRLLPVLVTGSREPLVTALLRSLGEAVDRTCHRGKRPEVLGRIQEAAGLLPPLAIGDSQAIALIREAVAHVIESGKGSGILVVLDELGKFLEYAALHPDRQDIFFLQSVADAASHSGRSPILVVGLLHQGFNAYAEQLSHPAQKEWEKVAGRFDEILFNQPLEQTAGLVADALNVRTGCLPLKLKTRARGEMERTLELGWYGAGAGRRSLIDLSVRLYPLHPSVLPVLVRLFSRFGQNERSLFSFLFSDEPYSLREFSERSIDSGRFYRLPELYDYTRAAFGHRLNVLSYRSHWNQIESVIESFPQSKEHAFELRVLKAVGVLNLLDHPGLVPTERALGVAVDGGQSEQKLLPNALRRLRKERSIVYFRGLAGGYCLWPHTSVNLERAYQEAGRAIPLPRRVGSLIRDDLETRPLVARRHYIETGNLRHFDVQYAPVEDLQSFVCEPAESADGRIVVALCETEAERQLALKVAGGNSTKDREDLLIAVPNPLQGLSKVLHEVLRWEWVSQNVPELNNDSYAAEEVARQLDAARLVLDRHLRNYVGLRQLGDTMELAWFHRGSRLEVSGGRDLLQRISAICDRIYDRAPLIRNELVNRRALSSAAAAARMRLIERILGHGDEHQLGMDEKGTPPEMSMYLSVLRKAGLHRKVGDGWALMEPPECDDPCRVRPVFARIAELLEQASDARVNVSELLDQLRKPPFGVREGLAPLLLAVFAATREQDVAFYLDGSFLRNVTGYEFQRLVKAPETFEMQLCRVTGLRAAVFQRLSRLLGGERAGSKKAEILDVVRPLCVFAAQLPAYTQRTSSLSDDARRVRDALLSAEDPANLLFSSLPGACGLPPFLPDETSSGSRVKKFVDRLRHAMDELRGTYPALVEKIRSELLAAFDRPGAFAQAREGIAATAEQLLVAVGEPRVKAFCLRLSDNRLGEQEWLESIASLLCAKPPAKWADFDCRRFGEELIRLAHQFRRVESTVFAAKSPRNDVQLAMRVAITNRDGSEVQQVVYADPAEESRVAELEARFSDVLGSEGRLGIIAATRAIWSQLRASEGDSPAGQPN